MDDYNTEAQFLEVVLVLKTLIDSHQNVTLALGLNDQLSVGKSAPLGFRDGQDVMVGKGLPETRIDALVYKDPLSMSHSLASSRNKTVCSRLTVMKSRKKLSTVSPSPM